MPLISLFVFLYIFSSLPNIYTQPPLSYNLTYHFSLSFKNPLPHVTHNLLLCLILFLLFTSFSLNNPNSPHCFLFSMCLSLSIQSFFLPLFRGSRKVKNLYYHYFFHYVTRHLISLKIPYFLSLSMTLITHSLQLSLFLSIIYYINL